LPLIFGILPKNVTERLALNLPQLLYFFILSTAISFVAFWMFFWEDYQMTLFTHYPTVIDQHLGPYRIHAIYISMNGAVALLFSLYLISIKSSKKYLIFTLLIADIIILLFLLLLIKKGPILSLVISGSYLAFSYKRKYIIIALGALYLIFIGVISFNPKANSKFSELLNIGGKNNTELTSTNIRLSIYACVKSVIPDAGVFGYGVGDSNKVLVDCYDSNDSQLVDREYNSHNQYLSILLKTGYLGLFVFFIYLIYLFSSAYKYKGYLTVAVLLFYLLMMFSENILERENGVVYFCFFILLLYTTQKFQNYSSSVDVKNS
jgi:O-antigen ligase